MKNPSKSKAIFLGWFLDSSFSGTSISFIDISSCSDSSSHSHDITLYAKWEEIPPINKPSLEKNTFTYNGTEQTFNLIFSSGNTISTSTKTYNIADLVEVKFIGENAKETIVSSSIINGILTYSAKGKNVTPYKFIISIKNNNFTWDDNSTNNLEFSITMNKKAITTISWSSNEFTYNGKPQYPTATIGEIIEGDDCYVVISNNNVNAGSYTAEVSSLEGTHKNNYTLEGINKKYNYTILPAKLKSLNENISTIDTYYKEGDDLTLSKYNNYKINGVNGEIISDGIINSINADNAIFDNSKKSSIRVGDYIYYYSTATISIIFSTQNKNYVTTTLNAFLNVYAVANIGNVYFGTVKKALDSNISNPQIYLIPGLNPTLRENAEVKSGTTLNIVYTQGKFNNNRENSVINEDYFASNISFLKNTLTIASNVTLNNNGEIKIDGAVGHSKTTYGGQTSGEYTKILMDNNSTINNYGTIYCLGYIADSPDCEISNIFIYNGKITAPLVIYDFKGGSRSYNLNSNKICPFKIYDLPNVQSKLTIKAGSLYEGLIGVYANDTYFNKEVNAIGTTQSQNTLFKLTSGDITIKYNLSNTGNDLTEKMKNSYMDIILNGNCTTGSFAIDLKLTIFDFKLDTSNYYCPLSYKFNITQKSSTLTIDTKLEFLPGSKLIINKGATVNINKNVIFYENYVDQFEKHAYPNNKNKAIFSVNGICIINASFAGIIDTQENNAQLYVSNNQCTDIIDGNSDANSSNALYKEIKYAQSSYTNGLEPVTLDGNASLPAIGKINNSTEYSQFNSSQYYLSNGKSWIPQKSDKTYKVYYHYKYYDNVNNKIIQTETIITYNIFDGISPQLSPLSVEELKYYSFIENDWYTDTDYTIKYDSETIQIVANGEYHLYLKYTPIKYTIEYIDINNENNFETTEFTYETIDTVILLNPTMEDRTFIGWYVDDSLSSNSKKILPGLTGRDNILNLIDQIESNNINNYTLTLYGKFAKTYNISFVIDNETISTGITIDTEKVEENGKLTTLDTLSKDLFAKENVDSFKYYFDKWTTSDGVEFTSQTIINSDLILYANWIEKEITLTIIYSNQELGINIDNDYRYYKEGTTISSINPYGFKDKDKISDVQKYFDENNYIIRSDKFEVNGINEINSNEIINWEFTVNNPTAVANWDTYYKVFISELTNATCTIKADNTININEIKEKGKINTINSYLFVLENTDINYEIKHIESTDAFSEWAWKDNYKNYTSKVKINYFNKKNLQISISKEFTTTHKREYKNFSWNYTWGKFNPESGKIKIE